MFNKKRQVRVFGRQLSTVGTLIAMNNLKASVEHYDTFEFSINGAAFDVFTVKFKASDADYEKIKRQMKKYGIATL